jgi:hypothetical protein
LAEAVEKVGRWAMREFEQISFAADATPQRQPQRLLAPPGRRFAMFCSVPVIKAACCYSARKKFLADGS